MAHHAYRNSAALWRLTMVFVVIAALVLNVVSGAYSGLVHAHDHEHAASDHHRDEHAVDHTEARSDLKEVSVKLGLPDGGAGSLDQTHEHPADGALSLPNLISWTYCDSQASWSSPRPDKVVIREFETSERPPRAA